MTYAAKEICAVLTRFEEKVEEPLKQRYLSFVKQISQSQVWQGMKPARPAGAIRSAPPMNDLAMQNHAIGNTRPSIRVVVADDHNRVRTGIRLLLAGVADIQVVGEAVNGMQALELAQTLQPDILLLDVEMPILNGLEVAARLHQSSIGVQILALSAYDDPQYVKGMLENGASGYLIKDDVPAKLVPALRSVAAGEKNWLSKRLR